MTGALVAAVLQWMATMGTAAFIVNPALGAAARRTAISLAILTCDDSGGVQMCVCADVAGRGALPLSPREERGSTYACRA